MSQIPPLPLPPVAARVRWEWISTGFNMFIAQWQAWVLNTLVLLAVLFIPIGLTLVGGFTSIALLDERASIAPFVAVVALGLLLVLLLAGFSSFLVAGMYRSAYKQLHGGQVELKDLVSGTDVFVPMFVVTLIVIAGSTIGLFFCLVPAFIVGGLAFFAVPLVAIRKLGPIEAIKTSIGTTKNDLLSFTLFALVVGLLGAAGGNFCYVGLLATYPLVFTISVAAYRDCFEAPPPAVHEPSRI